MHVTVTVGHVKHLINSKKMYILGELPIRTPDGMQTEKHSKF